MSIELERMNRENEHPEIQMIKAKFVCAWAEMRENIHTQTDEMGCVPNSSNGLEVYQKP